MRKSLRIIKIVLLTTCLTIPMSSCALLGWIATSTLTSPHRQAVTFENKKLGIDGNSVSKNNSGIISSKNVSTIKEAEEVFITSVPWPIIWLLMVGWPLALIGWMIDPPCEIYRKYKQRKRKC